MYTAASIAIFITMGLALIRALRGPSVYDRVLAVNLFGTKTVLLLSVVAFLYGRPDFLDLALAYALINFIGVLAVLQFFENRQELADESADHIACVTPQQTPASDAATVVEKSPR